MKAFLLAQINPAKSLRQIVTDRTFYCRSIIAALLLRLFI